MEQWSTPQGRGASALMCYCLLLPPWDGFSAARSPHAGTTEPMTSSTLCLGGNGLSQPGRHTSHCESPSTLCRGLGVSAERVSAVHTRWCLRAE